MSGFIDLRPDHHGIDSNGEDSFWPSFTDIMTVIVMIFILSSLVMFIRNWQLMQNLSATEAAEEQARERIRDTLSQNATLEEQLEYLEEQLMLSRLQTMKTLESKARQERIQSKKISNLRSENATLQQGLTDLKLTLTKTQSQLHVQITQTEQLIRDLETQKSAIAETEQALAVNQSELAQLKSEKQLLEATMSGLSQQNEILKTTNQTQLSELNTLKSEEENTTTDLNALREEYANLQTEYNKLIRPARSTKGKVVVAVKYFLGNGEKKYQLQQNNQWAGISRSALDEKLADLKSKHKDNLYIKIVFPDDSGLDYSEAWSFTRDMLNNYDYYYQEKAVK